MLGFIKLLFGRSTKSSKPTGSSSHVHDQLNFITVEVLRSPYLNEAGRNEFIKYFTELKKAHQSKNPKEASSTLRQELLSKLPTLLNEHGKTLPNPSILIGNMYAAGSIKQTRHADLVKFRANNGVKQFTIEDSGGGSCKWCQSKNGVLMDIHTDVEALIEKHCTCTPYCKCFLKPIVNFS